MNDTKNQPEQLTFFAEEHPANHSALPASEKDWQTLVATWPSTFLELLMTYAPGGLYGKTSPASCRATEDGTLLSFSERWANSGMGGPTGCLTLSTSEYHSAAVACSLSDVLEDGNVPQRYYLSATACKGILRRAEARGKSLPPPLQEALEAVASGRTSTATEG